MVENGCCVGHELKTNLVNNSCSTSCSLVVCSIVLVSLAQRLIAIAWQNVAWVGSITLLYMKEDWLVG